MEPLVSVITPFRNMAAFLPEAIESVLAQTARSWELLLVDDGSDDASGAVAERYARSDRRIRLLSASGSGRTGAAAARNIGLEAARGTFVSFLDADDLFVPDNLERQLALAARHPQAALISGAARWWHPLNECADWIDAVRHFAPGPYKPPVLLDNLILLSRDQVPCTCAVLARRKVVCAVGGFEERLALYEDQSLWVKLFARYPAYLGTHLTSFYRQHDGSTSTLAQSRGEYRLLGPHPARAEFLDWTEQYLRTDGRQPGSTMRALHVAQAVARKSGSGLSVSERLCRALLGAEQLKRRLGARMRGRRHRPSGLQHGSGMAR